MRTSLVLTALALACASPALAAPPVELLPPASASRSANASAPWHFDFEVDPTAYVLSGYSLHVGIGYERLRLDLGAYAMALPELIHGNNDFDVSFNGFGAKLHFFPFEAQEGFFVGIDSGVSRVLAQRKGTELAATDLQVNVGASLGYRIAFGAGFYVTPWLGVGYALGAEDVMLMDTTFEAMPVTIFPAIHLGYRAF